MQIIGGIARNIKLDVPQGLEVRPTSGRSRKALFDSIANKIPNANVLDIFAGSGALSLESLSRGANSAWLIELDKLHIVAIENNIKKVQKAGVTADVQIIKGDATNNSIFNRIPAKIDIIFADPPYIKSVKYFHNLLSDDLFCNKFAGATLIWEIPDIVGALGEFLNNCSVKNSSIRKFGSTNFLICEIGEVTK